MDVFSHDGGAETWNPDKIARFIKTQASANVDDRLGARDTFVLARLLAAEQGSGRAEGLEVLKRWRLARK
tara:strand:- start:152 stop:361 length:210 start_codon:yes stop_codon:yes gene_type:complete